MARLPRIVLPGYLHLIVQTAQRGRNVFPDANARQSYLDALREAARESKVAVHAYGLNDDEARLLVSPSATSGLGTMLQSVNRRYVPGLNRALGMTGSPWAGRYRSVVIDPSTHFRAVLRFVEGGLPGTDEPLPGDRSSVRHHLGLERQPVITEHSGLWAYGNTPFEREAAFARWLAQDTDPDMATILRAALAGWVVGGERFHDEVEAAAGRRARQRPPGRPKSTPK